MQMERGLERLRPVSGNPGQPWWNYRNRLWMDKAEASQQETHSCFRPADFHPWLQTYLGGQSWTGPWAPWPSALGWGLCRSCPGWEWPLAAGGGRSRSGPASPWSCCTLTTSHTRREKTSSTIKNTGPRYLIYHILLFLEHERLSVQMKPVLTAS